MGKISKKVSKGLGAAIQEAKEKMSGESSEVQELLNSGVEAHKKRRKKTTKEPETGENSLFDAIMPPEEKPVEQKSHMRTHEEVCADDIKKAHDRGYQEPDFDFRNYYEKGQIIYYIHVLGGGINTKEMKRLKIRTIYPRMMVCDEEKSCCQCIGYSQKEYIFNTAKEAEPVYKSINLAAEDAPKSPKSTSKVDEGTDEGVDDNGTENEAYTRLEEVLNEN